MAIGRGKVVTTNDLAVVTPFRKQVLKVRLLLRQRDLGAVRVGSVDDYQGQEELIVLVSTVLGSAAAAGARAPPLAHGLMSSPNRFNVAITRAKALLLMVVVVVVVGGPNVCMELP